MVEDRYNGRAVLKHVGNDVHITVRAAYPDLLLYELTKEVKWLVENPDEGWAGLRCDVTVPCIEPCRLKQPGRGMFEVGKLKESKRRRRGLWHQKGSPREALEGTSMPSILRHPQFRRWDQALPEEPGEP